MKYFLLLLMVLFPTGIFGAQAGTNILVTQNGTTATALSVPVFNTGSNVISGPISIASNTNATLTGNLLANGATITNTLTLSGLTLGSVPFAGTGGLISQDNANFFWDDTNNRLGIGTATPGMALVVTGNATVNYAYTKGVVITRDDALYFSDVTTPGSSGNLDTILNRSSAGTFGFANSTGTSGTGGILASNITANGNITAANLTSGTYTPVTNLVANLDAASVGICQYMRVGNTVTVSGRITVDPTTTLTNTELGLSLPVASNFSSADQAGGTAYATAIAAQGAAILSDATNDRVTVQFRAVDVTSQPMYFTFTYLIQ